MAKSIKLNDNTYIDATGVYDSTLTQTQRELNEAFDKHSTSYAWTGGGGSFSMRNAAAIIAVYKPDTGIKALLLYIPSSAVVPFINEAGSWTFTYNSESATITNPYYGYSHVYMFW